MDRLLSLLIETQIFGRVPIMKRMVAPICRAKAFLSILVLATALVFALAAFDTTLSGDSAIFNTLRLDGEGNQRFLAQFDLSPLLSVASVLLLFVTLLLWRKWWESTIVLFILPLQALTIALPKWLYGRPRPEGPLEGSMNSFPSGTAVTSLLVLGLAIYFVGQFVPNKGLRLGLQLAMGTGIATLGVFRVLASEHWPSDLVGGYLIGGLALFALVWLYHRLKGRRLSFRLHQRMAAA